jgi:hypothetical protein
MSLGMRQAMRTALDPLRLVQLYVLVLGVGLLLDGALLMLLNALGVQVPALNTTDTRHNLLHVAWGVALLVVSFAARNGHEIRAAWAAVVFGAFYVALGVVGLTIDQPFGMQLGPGENAFHFVVGPLALALGAWALRAPGPVVAPSRTAAPRATPRSAPAAHRRARRRPGKVRGHQHRR